MEDIIWCVKQHQNLYEKPKFGAIAKKQREESWEEIGIDLGLSAEFVKKKWQNIRASYVKHLKQDPKYINYKWTNQMEFVRPFLDLENDDEESHSEESPIEDGPPAKQSNENGVIAFGVFKADETLNVPKKKKKNKKLLVKEASAKEQLLKGLKSPLEEPKAVQNTEEEIPETPEKTSSSPKKKIPVEKSSPMKVVDIDDHDDSSIDLAVQQEELRLQQNGYVEQVADAAAPMTTLATPEKKQTVKKAAPRKRKATIKETEIENLRAAIMQVDANDVDSLQNKEKTPAAALPNKPEAKKAAPRKRRPTIKQTEIHELVEAAKQSANDGEKPLENNADTNATVVKKAAPRKRRPTLKETQLMQLKAELLEEQQQASNEKAVSTPKKQETKNGPAPKKRRTKEEMKLSKEASLKLLNSSLQLVQPIQTAVAQSTPYAVSTATQSKAAQEPMDSTAAQCLKTNYLVNMPHNRLSMDSSSSSQLDAALNSTNSNQALDGTELIFLGFAKTLKSFAPRRQSLTKLKIAQIIMEQEMHHYEDEGRETAANKN